MSHLMCYQNGGYLLQVRPETIGYTTSDALAFLILPLTPAEREEACNRMRQAIVDLARAVPRGNA